MTAPDRGGAAAGIGCMLAGGVLLTINDGLMKWTGQFLPVGEMLFFRGLSVLIPLALLVWRFGGWTALRIRDWRSQTFRAALMVGAAFAFITSLNFLPLADAIAITFASPLFVTALAPFALPERVGWRRWTAVAVGFAGVVLMLKPTGDVFRAVALLPLATALMIAFSDLVTRRMSATESSVATMGFTMLAIAAAALFTAPFGWKAPSAVELLMLVGAGVTLGCSHFLMIEAFRLAEATVAAPFRYATVLSAALIGYVVWGDVPDAWMVAGSILVVGSGLYIFARERRRDARR